MMEARGIGLVGLGVMGRNLALNIAEKGFPVAAFDPWEQARDGFAAVLAAEKPERIILADSIPDMLAVLAPPRLVLIMVKAGDAVDAMIDRLKPHLDKGDTLIDGGNSHFGETISREAALADAGIHFIGLGVSGGEEGARRGPSLMAGGNEAAYGQARGVLEAIAARYRDEPCCALMGGDGAGHFVKMVHNGIEYGLMQLIGEIFQLMRDVFGMKHADMATVFRNWNRTELASYLVEITATILAARDPETSGPLVESILDKAGQKRTGRWSSETALMLGIPAVTIAEAVFARSIASLKEERLVASGRLTGPEIPRRPDRGDGQIEALRQALLAGFIVTYAQGFELLEAGGRHFGWPLDLAMVARVWRGGCIIRAGLLDDMASAFEGDGPWRNLMCAPVFASLLGKAQDGWRQTLALAIRQGVPVPAASSTLAYYDGMRSPRLWASLTQAQRDFFGAHGYERTDRKGMFHTQWPARE